MKPCEQCGAEVVRTGGRGPWPKRCASCAARKDDGVCKGCGAVTRRTRADGRGRVPAWCADCSKERAREAKRVQNLKPEVHERIKERSARYYEERRQDPAFRELQRERYRARRSDPARLAADRAGYRARHLRYQFGMTPADFDALLARQGGRCAICRTDAPGQKGFHVDHCHASGKVRGLLCGPCNVGIGNLRDDPALLLAAVEYLRRT